MQEARSGTPGYLYKLEYAPANLCQFMQNLQHFLGQNSKNQNPNRFVNKIGWPKRREFQWSLGRALRHNVGRWSSSRESVRQRSEKNLQCIFVTE